MSSRCDFVAHRIVFAYIDYQAHLTMHSKHSFRSAGEKKQQQQEIY